MSAKPTNMSDTRDRMFDCYGNLYTIIRMPSTGFCGFHALSYCLNGNTESYASVIDDCMNVFRNIPELFRLRTNFGGRRNSSLTLQEYASFMQTANQRVQCGLSVDNHAWCEDGHLAAMSLVYDIAICVFPLQTKEWYVFNELAERGYILLLMSPGHFDVLRGLVPDAAHTHGVSRDTFGTPDEAWDCLQREYSFEFVDNFPEGYAGIRILNNPVVQFRAQTPETAVSTDEPAPKHKKTSHGCDYLGCNYVAKNNKALAMHKMQVHTRSQTQVELCDIHEQHSCDYLGCSYVAKNNQGLALHKSRVHRSSKKEVDLCNTREQTPIRDQHSCASASSTICENECYSDSLNVQDVRISTVRSEPVQRCDYPGCSYVAKNDKALAMHKFRVHKSPKREVDLCNTHEQTPIGDRHSCAPASGKTCQNVCYSDSHNITDVSMSTVNLLETDRQTVTSYASTDANSEASVETNFSRRSERIAQKRNITRVEIEPHSVMPKRGRYACDINGCGSVHDTSRGLSIHKSKCHAATVPACDAMSVESSSESVTTEHSTSYGLRRSTRISSQNRTFASRDRAPDTKVIRKTTNRATAISEDGCSRSVDSDVDNSNVDEHADISQVHNRKTKKRHSKISFSKKIAELEKTILPKKKTKQQADPLYDKLKDYHDILLKSVSNTTTEKLSSEVLHVISNPNVINDCDRRFTWTKEDEERLNELNSTCKMIQPSTHWTWGAGDDTEQGRYNNKRMELCVTHECEWKLIECQDCGSTGLLVGDQIDSEVCYDCMKLRHVNEKERQRRHEAWNKVKPLNRDFPKAANGEDLPYLQPGDKAVIAPIHPVVTLKKNYFADKRMRLETISLIQDPLPTWCKVLPRQTLKDRFLVIERRVRDAAKYIVASAERVRQWLRYLFLHHKDFIRLRRENELTIDEDAIEALGPNLELAEVDCDLAEHTTSESEQLQKAVDREDEGLTDATVSSGFSETHVFSFDRYPELYLKSKDVLRIRKEGKLEILRDDSVRKQTYSASANLAFPHLYPHGEMSPLDFQDYKLGRYLLKKQSLFAHKMADGRLQWNFAEDDIHMAHQYSRLSEQTVRANVGYYISSHPSVSHVPLNSIITAFRDGVDKDSGLLDSHLPDLTTVMSQLPNSRQKWFQERLGIEAISRDIGSPNVFVTINLDPRASPDVRRLIYKLEHGEDMDRDEPFLTNTAEFTKLMQKYAPFVAIYLYRKVKIMMRVFFTNICGISEKEVDNNWTQRDITENGWWWGRVEFTETRGVPHFHFLAKLPHVLDTGLLGRIIHNGRVVRQEMKCGNIKPAKREQAWHMIEMGLLASRYAALFAHSISMASFYSEDVGIDDHDSTKVIRLEDYRKEFAQNYKEGKIDLKTHPIMRRFDDPECRPNQWHEMAEVASVSCLHQCIRGSCGGDPLSGDGCRFDFPKKELKHTVAATMQVNANQMEARILLRRTCSRVANLNRYLIRFLRSNHDVSPLIDSAHKLRYATKYCAKSGKHSQLLDEMIEHLNKRMTDLLPPNMKQVLSHLLLADCSHRAFISKQELAYKVMNLPDVMKSFPKVDVVGFYKRANLQVAYDDENTIEYSDRTEYSAYAERCRDDTDLGRGLTKEALEKMCLNDFAETVQHKWIKTKNADTTVIDDSTKRKFRTRDVSSGHWHLTLCRRRKHIRPSTVLYTAPAVDYEFVDHGKTTTQTTFYDLPIEKRHQLYRAYYEIVMYVPWQSTPDETFLSDDSRTILNDRQRHAELDSRHSLQRLEEFFKVYKQMYDCGKVAPPNSAWQRDNQFSYSMFLVSQHNRDIHLDRVDNQGVLKAQFEDVDELVNVDVDIRGDVNDVSDLSEYPTFENFMPPDTFRAIVEQKAPESSDICVAFPLHHQWQQLEELATHNKMKRFIANPPPSPVAYDDMSPIQKFAVDVGKDEDHQMLFVCGKAGSGKTAVALKICEHFRGRVQATAYTGKAASLFNGPTIHSLFAWSHNEHKSLASEMKPDSKKVEEFRVAHEGIDLFVVEEALAVPPAYIALMDEMMTVAFNPKHRLNSQSELPPFGGKKMLFLGDQAQLPPIGGPAVYDSGRSTDDVGKKRRESKVSKRTTTGQLLFEKYLVPNCIYLQRGQRNTGLLGEICDRMRQGQLSENDCAMLTYQRTRFPEVQTDFGIHYQNEMCSMHNWRQLWNECLLSTPARRLIICKASYHVTSDNDQIVEVLSTLPPQAYDYAPDILCVAEGCEVRLLQNVNTAAGLVTSQSGTVVKVIFNNADAKLLLAGEHAVPYCIVVSFAGFQGFVDKKNGTDTRIFPFRNQPTWVPIYRKRFNVKISHLPTWIRKKQLEKECFRTQFPLDLASHVTAHRAQGQTMANCLVSVDLGLENPDMKMPLEMSSLLYVACTRVTKLENLFVSPIHPSVWRKIGQSEADKHRRTVDEKLQNASKEFAASHGLYQEMQDELVWTADTSKNADEWRLLQEQREPPISNRQAERCVTQSTSNEDFCVDIGDSQFSMFCKPVLSERHIGIDQGVENFAIAVVERTLGENPNIVAARNYTCLELPKRLKASDVMVALCKHTDLLLWMNCCYGDRMVDRVVVHLEQMDARNRNSKELSAKLGKLLQQQAVDSDVCIVKMSQPHIHRSTGPVFHLGDEIIEALEQQDALCQQQRSRADSNPAVVQRDESDSEPSDVEPADSAGERKRQSASREYRAKKKMSRAVFRYIIEADDDKLQQMKLTINQDVQMYWREKLACDPKVKLDDVGDALLHALDELLCGSSNFRQLVPAAPSVHVNRTVAIAVFPDTTYWIVLNCRWNTFVLENFGCFSSGLRNCYYKDPSTVAMIKNKMAENDALWSALSDFAGNSFHDAVDHIKVVVKQLTGHTELGLGNEKAGALTDATVKAMKMICDGVIGKNSKLCDRRDKILGSLYCRISTVHRDRKFQVLRTAGKHTNSVLSCLSWFKENLSDFVETRREILTEAEKRMFFGAMLKLAHANECRMEMLQLSDTVKVKLCSDDVSIQMQCDKTYTRNIADLVLIAMSKNQQHVKAIAANSGKSNRVAKPASVSEQNNDDVEQ